MKGKKISWDQVVGEMEGGGLIVPRRKICYTTTKHSFFVKLTPTPGAPSRLTR